MQRAERLINETKQRIEAGAAARLDEKQAESQLSSRQTDLLGAEFAFVAQEYALKNQICDNFGEWKQIRIQPTETLSAVPRALSKEESWSRGLAQRPDLLQAKTDLERQGIVLKYLRNQIFPQLDLVGSYGQAGSDGGHSAVHRRHYWLRDRTKN